MEFDIYSVTQLRFRLETKLLQENESYFLSAACAAASRAIGTRNGEQET
jgi:hypothetical protein